MSRHWNPEEELARFGAEETVPRGERAWPDGATAGLLMVSVCCLALGAVIYQFAGPRDVIDESIGRQARH